MQKGGRNAGSKNFDYYDIGTFEDDPPLPSEDIKNDFDKCVILFKDLGFDGNSSFKPFYK